jgi:hypothetical protein
MTKGMPALPEMDFGEVGNGFAKDALDALLHRQCRTRAVRAGASQLDGDNAVTDVNQFDVASVGVKHRTNASQRYFRTIPHFEVCRTEEVGLCAMGSEEF